MWEWCVSSGYGSPSPVHCMSNVLTCPVWSIGPFYLASHARCGVPCPLITVCLVWSGVVQCDPLAPTADVTMPMCTLVLSSGRLRHAPTAHPGQLSGYLWWCGWATEVTNPPFGPVSAWSQCSLLFGTYSISTVFRGCFVCMFPIVSVEVLQLKELGYECSFLVSGCFFTTELFTMLLKVLWTWKNLPNIWWSYNIPTMASSWWIQYLSYCFKRSLKDTHLLFSNW